MAVVTTFVGRLSRAALDLVFPARCFVCGAGGTFLCDACAAALPRAGPPRCPRCWWPGGAGFCPPCQAAPPAFDGLRAVFVYREAVRELVYALKYRGMTALAGPMASSLAEAVRWQEGLKVDAVVPVPLSGLRRRTRGYNQAEALARPLARELSLPLRARALARRRHTPPQARSRDADERRRNVSGAFIAGSDVGGLRVLLVDDVTTTGATLAACAAALKQAGARSVWALAFARED